MDYFRRGLAALVLLISFTAYGEGYVPSSVESSAGSEDSDSFLPSPDLVLARDDLQAFGSLAEALASVPFLQVSGGSGGYGSAMFSARGGGGDNPFSQVHIRVDGVSINSPDMAPASLISVPLDSIAEVRVYDGGRGSAYGSGAVGAVIDIITVQETEPSFGASASYGTYNAWSASASGGYSTDRWGLSAFFVSDGEEGFRENGGGYVLSSGISSRYDFTDEWLVRSSLRAGYSDAGNAGSIQDDDPITASYNTEDAARSVEASFLVSADYETPSRSFRLPLSVLYRRREFDYASNLAYGSDPASTYSYVQPSFSPSASIRFRNGVLSVGADVSSTVYRGEHYSDLARLHSDFAYGMMQTSLSPYIGYRHSLADRLSLSAGARYDFTLFSAHKDALRVSDTYHNAAFDASLEYSPALPHTLFLSAGTVYRIPFLDEKASLTGWGDSVNLGLEPERGVNAELGWRFADSFPLFGRISVSLKGFFTYMVGEVGYVYDSITYTGRNVNLDATRRVGGTFLFRHDVRDYIGYSLGFTYTDGRFADGEYEGNLVPYLAPWKLTADIHSDIKKIGIYVRLYSTVEGSKYLAGDRANEGPLAGVVPLLGLHVRWRVPLPRHVRHVLTVSGQVDNLLNWEHDSYALYSYGEVYRYPAAPLTAKLWVSFSL